MVIRVQPTIRPCDVENIGDFGRYYNRAWLAWHGHPNGAQAVNVQGVTDNTVTVVDLEGRAHIVTWNQAQRDFSFGTPDLGMVNSEHTLLYLYRRAPREAHRGYRPGAIQSAVFNGWDVRQVLPRLDASEREVIRNIFFPQYYHPSDAVEQLRNGERVGCAVSRNLGLFTRSGWKYPGIAYRRHIVGHLEEYKFAVVPKMHLDSVSIIREKLGVEVIVK